MTPGPNPQLAHDWASIRAELRSAVPDSTFEIWLAPLTRARARRRHADRRRARRDPQLGRRSLRARAADVRGRGPRPRDDVDVVAPDAPLERAAPQPGDGRRRRGRRAPSPSFHPKLTFDQFVIGDANRFAHAAALAVAELPGQAYNPLFLYGPPGLGKTHLLHAIGNYVQAHGGGLRVRSTTAERFTNEFVAALQTRDIDEFKARFRDTDVLLIDDVQFLQRKAKTEEEFFHTFNALHETGSQLVLTCDRLPADMAALEARLLERFQSGLVAELAPPDLATRLAILRKRVAPRRHRARRRGRAARHRAPHHHQHPRARGRADPRRRLPLAHGPPDRRRARRRGARRPLPARAPRPAGLPTIERVQELTCDAFSISREELLSSGRSGRVAWPRQVAMYLAREHTGATLPAIGREFGGRNHTTVMYACRRAAERIAADPAAQAAVHSPRAPPNATRADRPSDLTHSPHSFRARPAPPGPHPPRFLALLHTCTGPMTSKQHHPRCSS